MKNKKYKLIALVGKAGSGKDTILKEIEKLNNPIVHSIVSYTTRPGREGEVEGKDYYFVTENEFKQMIDNHQMLEYVQFNNWWYGTGINCLKKNKLNIGIFNPSGIKALSVFPEIDLKIYGIAASDKQRLLRQLNREESPNVPEIIRRYAADEQDFSNLKFDNIKIFVNEDRNDLKNIVAEITDHFWYAELGKND